MLVDAGAGQTGLRRTAVGAVAAGRSALLPRSDAPVRPVPARRRPRWSRRYRAVLITADVLIAALAGLVMLAMRPGYGLPEPYVLLSLALPAVWPLIQGIAGSYSPRFFGTGSEEFRKAARGGLFLLAGISVVS